VTRAVLREQDINVRCFSAFAAIGLALATGACGGSGATIIELRVDNAADAPAPHHLVLDWLDGERFLFRDRRVPADGALGTATPLAKIRIELTGRRQGIRRAVVRGMDSDEMIVSEGTASMDLGGSGQIGALLILSAGRRPDRDRDAVPDEIDGCPDDASTSGPCPVADGGVDDGSPNDGVDEPTGGGGDQRPPAEAGLDAPREGGVDRPDDTPDAPPRDMGMDLPRDMGGGDVGLNVPVNDPVPFNCGIALLVSSSVNSAVDKLLLARLTGLGCMPAQTSDGTLDPTDANGKSVVVISDNVDGSLVKGILKSVAVPLMIMRPDVFDDHGMTGPTDGTDWARTATEALMDIADPTHPLAAGLGGTVSFHTQPWPVGWGKPELTAARVGSIVGNPNRWILFGYDAGVMMTGGFRAPARRVGYPIHADGQPKLNGNGWALFDAAIHWLTGN
jgi:hypothetical protein